MMDKLIIQKEIPKISSINRTIRLAPECFDAITNISKNTGVSFNKVVSQCLEFALNHIDEDLKKAPEEE